jgi:hypothetical protein
MVKVQRTVIFILRDDLSGLAGRVYCLNGLGLWIQYFIECTLQSLFQFLW